jgi:hypothetical protein
MVLRPRTRSALARSRSMSMASRRHGHVRRPIARQERLVGSGDVVRRRMGRGDDDNAGAGDYMLSM